MRIGSKAEYYSMMERGLLGNTLRNWRTVEEAWDSGAPYIGFRQIGAGGGGIHRVVPRYDLYAMFDVLSLEGTFIMDEAAPDTDVQLQGEVCRTFRGLEGHLGIRTGHRMRDSMRLGLLNHLIGLRVHLLLNHFLDPSSRDDLELLLERYPEATIELAAYPYTLGKLRGRNTIIWEVRDY